MWQQVYAISKTQISKTFAINYEFSSQNLIVKATSGSANTTWERAGYLKPVFLVPEVGQVKTRRISLIVGTQYLTIPTFEPTYFLEYHFLRYFLDIDLVFWINL